MRQCLTNACRQLNKEGYTYCISISNYCSLLFMEKNEGGKTMKRLFTLIGLSAFVVLNSCQKEISDGDPPTPASPSCKVVNAYYYANAQIYDSASFVYNGVKVMKAESDIKLVSYTYNGANITSLSYYDKLAKSVSFDYSADYDANNRIKSLKVNYYPGRFSAENNQFTYLFSYKGDNLDK